MNSACEKSMRRQWQQVVWLLSEMVAVKMDNIITYGILNRSCETSGRWQWHQLVAPLSEMVVVKIQPNIITYGTANSAREKSRR